jgi:hypothetical protein
MNGTQCKPCKLKHARHILQGIYCKAYIAMHKWICLDCLARTTIIGQRRGMNEIQFTPDNAGPISTGGSEKPKALPLPEAIVDSLEKSPDKAGLNRVRGIVAEKLIKAESHQQMQWALGDALKGMEDARPLLGPDDGDAYAAYHDHLTAQVVALQIGKGQQGQMAELVSKLSR